MQDNEAQQLLLEILSHAEEGKFTEFHFITTWKDFIYYWRLSKSNKVIIKALRDAANNVFKEYCKEVVLGTADLTQLLAYSHLQDVIAFYEKDLLVLKRMLDEYDEYLGQGHFWHSFLGGERTLPWNTL